MPFKIKAPTGSRYGVLIYLESGYFLLGLAYKDGITFLSLVNLYAGYRGYSF